MPAQDAVNEHAQIVPLKVHPVVPHAKAMQQPSAAFQLAKVVELRAQDLLWQPLINQYVKGQRDRMIDLMAWNADGTRMPWRMHSEYLYRLYLVLLGSAKPIVTGAFSPEGSAAMIDLLALDAGGRDALAARPRAVFDVCPSPPLTWTSFGARKWLAKRSRRRTSRVVRCLSPAGRGPVRGRPVPGPGREARHRHHQPADGRLHGPDARPQHLGRRGDCQGVGRARLRCRGLGAIGAGASAMIAGGTTAIR